jgi:hypothetical protein
VAPIPGIKSNKPVIIDEVRAEGIRSTKNTGKAEIAKKNDNTAQPQKNPKNPPHTFSNSSFPLLWERL